MQLLQRWKTLDDTLLVRRTVAVENTDRKQGHRGYGLSEWLENRSKIFSNYFICTAWLGYPKTSLKVNNWSIGNYIRKSAKIHRFITILISFYLLVILVNISVGKSLSTKLAFVRFVFTVYYFVSTHLIEPLERFITNLTIIGSFFCEKWVETISYLHKGKG